MCLEFRLSIFKASLISSNSTYYFNKCSPTLQSLINIRAIQKWKLQQQQSFTSPISLFVNQGLTIIYKKFYSIPFYLSPPQTIYVICIMSGRRRGKPRKSTSSSPAIHGNTGKQPHREQGVDSSNTGVKLTKSQNQPTEDETKELAAQPNPNTEGEKPYTIHNMPMLLRDWKPDFDLKKDMKTSLEKIGRMLGNPVVTDDCTAHKLHMSYARILVEMDVSKAPSN